LGRLLWSPGQAVGDSRAPRLGSSSALSAKITSSSLHRRLYVFGGKLMVHYPSLSLSTAVVYRL